MKHKHHESLMRLIIMMVDVSEKTFLVNITKYWCYIINDHRWVRVQDYIVCQIEYSVHNSNFIITILVPAGIKSLIKKNSIRIWKLSNRNTTFEPNIQMYINFRFIILRKLSMQNIWSEPWSYCLKSQRSGGKIAKCWYKGESSYLKLLWLRR